MNEYDVIVLGAGAAGLMCALTAGKRGRRVLVIERSEKPGKKILISGGGRCNFTNLVVEPANFISRNPHFCISALKGFSNRDFIGMVEEHRIKYHEKKLGQLFCDGSSRQIVQMLTEECNMNGVEIVCNTQAVSIGKSTGFNVEAGGRIFTSASLVVATGGISIPKIGATGFGYELAKKFGHKVSDLKPGLVPLLLPSQLLMATSRIAGLSVSSRVKAGGMSFHENTLFTHRGLSGPAILQASSYWNDGDPIEVNFLPDADPDLKIEAVRLSRQTAGNFVSGFIPDRLAKALLGDEIFSKPMNQMNKSGLLNLKKTVTGFQFIPSGTEGFDKAEVTCGGVDTSGLSSKTMESKTVKGLYFIGEVVDVTGWLGGYNFQWAWSSGFAAGSYC